jgi:hypothetical protein
LKFEEFRGLDPEEVAAQCGGASSADDGPKPGIAGEQEATVADDTQLPEGSEPSADGEVDTSAGPRRIRLNAGTLVERLMAADPSLDQSSGLKLEQFSTRVVSNLTSSRRFVRAPVSSFQKAFRLMWMRTSTSMRLTIGTTRVLHLSTRTHPTSSPLWVMSVVTSLIQLVSPRPT